MYQKIPKISYCASVVDWNKIEATSPRVHTVAIWTFTFHKKSGCVWGDFEGQFQTSLQVKVINFFYLKIQIYYSHLSSIFCRSCQIQCFLDNVNAISKRLKYLIRVFTSNCNSNTSTLWNSSNSVQEALDFLWNVNVQIATVWSGIVLLGSNINFMPKKGMRQMCLNIWIDR